MKILAGILALSIFFNLCQLIWYNLDTERFENLMIQVDEVRRSSDELLEKTFLLDAKVHAYDMLWEQAGNPPIIWEFEE